MDQREGILVRCIGCDTWKGSPLEPFTGSVDLECGEREMKVNLTRNAYSHWLGYLQMKRFWKGNDESSPHASFTNAAGAGLRDES